MPQHTRNLRDGTITIVDGTAVTPLELIVTPDMGDLSFTEVHNVITIKSRGQLDHRRVGDEEELEVSFSMKYSQWSFSTGVATGVSVVDALTQRGGASAWVSTDETCAPYAIDLRFDIEDPCNAGLIETLTFEKFTVTSIAFQEGDEANSIKVSGRAFQTTPVRTYG